MDMQLGRRIEMLKEEFEEIAGAEISMSLYEDIENYYQQDCRKGIVNKHEYIGRIYGCKNTTKSIAVKHALFVVHRNIDSLIGRHPAESLRKMAYCLTYWTMVRARSDVRWGRYKYVTKWDFNLFNARLDGKRVFAWLDKLS
jgi:hypothetical protein